MPNTPAKTALGYTRFLDSFIVPLLERTGLHVETAKHKRTYTITLTLPQNLPANPL